MIDYWKKFEYGATYHEYYKSTGDWNLFLDHEDYNRFLKKHHRYFGGFTTLYAYCLIPNHFHFMFRVNKIEDINKNKLIHEDSETARSFKNKSTEIDLFLTDQLRRWYSSSALYLNKKYNQNGQVFLEKIKRVSVITEEKFHSLLCYIHPNPIHRGLSKTYEDWPYSSYNLYLDSSPEISASKIFENPGSGDLIKGKRYSYTYARRV